MKSIIVLSLACLLILSGCGKTAKKLTDDQVQRLKDFSTSASQVNTAASDQGITPPPANTPLPPSGSSSSLLGSSPIFFSATTATDDNTTKMKAILKKAVADKLCSMKASATASGTQVTFGSATGVDLTGTNVCPATFTVSSLMNGTPTVTANKRASASKITITYQANTAEFKKLADIDQFNFTADISFEMTQQNRLDYVIKAKLSGNGTIHSQKMGTVAMSMSSNSELDGNADKPGEETITGKSSVKMDFSDFLVELDAELKDGVTSYTLNGDKKTEAEIQDYFSGMTPSKPSASVGR